MAGLPLHLFPSGHPALMFSMKLSVYAHLCNISIIVGFMKYVNIVMENNYGSRKRE